MQKFLQIAQSAYTSTSQNPRWWILACLQIASLPFFTAAAARPSLMLSPFIAWWALSGIVLITATVYLWMDIDARKSKLPEQKTYQYFFSLCRNVAVLCLIFLGIMILLRMAYDVWAFLAIVSSVMAATAVLSLLFSVLCEQGIGSSLLLALDTWNKKISLAAQVAVALILAHGISFAVWKGLKLHFDFSRGFELLTHSATIWVLSLILGFITALCIAFLNCFLVHLFLDSIRRKKDQTAEEAMALKQAVLEASP